MEISFGLNGLNIISDFGTYCMGEQTRLRKAAYLCGLARTFAAGILESFSDVGTRGSWVEPVLS